MKNKEKFLNNIFIIVFSIISFIYFIYHFRNGLDDRLLADISLLLVFLLPRIIERIFRIKFSDKLELTYIIFIILAQFLGSIVNLYDYVWWYDLFSHFISGVLTSILAVMIINNVKLHNKYFNILFIICFTLMIASGWEFIEFTTDIISGSDVQHNLTTGVHDTMEDMLVAFLGSIIFSIYYYFNINKFKNYKLI